MTATPSPRVTAAQASAAAQAPFNAERWRQFWDHWQAQPQQCDGIDQLRQAVIKADPAILTEAAPWRQCFSSSPAAPPAPFQTNPLPVAWENQNDNASGTGYRECFATNGDRSALEAEIQAGRPVAVGWLHQGPATATTGGGHWSVVIGFSSTHAIHHDPNGEADLLHGGYTANTNGAAQHYSWTNWLPRWEADGPGSGWWLSCYA